jgi:hypothetical protein
MFEILLFLTMSYPGFDFLTLPTTPFDVPATIQGVEALSANPAGLARDGRSIFAYQNFWLTDSRATFLGIKLDKLGLLFSYINFGEIEYQDETPDDEVGPTFSPYVVRGGVYRGFRIDEELSVGLGLHYFYYKIYTSDAQNLLIDGGLRYSPLRFPFATFGLSFRNFGLKAGFEDITYKMPTELLFSISLTHKFLALDYTFDKIVTYDTEWNEVTGIGIEHRLQVWYKTPWGITIFGSYRRGREIDPIGIGLLLNYRNLHLSYGYRPAKLGFDSPHLLGLKIKF